MIGFGLRKALAAIFRSLFVIDVPDDVPGDWVLEALMPGNQMAKWIANAIDPGGFPTPPVLSTAGRRRTCGTPFGAARSVTSGTG